VVEGEDEVEEDRADGAHHHVRPGHHQQRQRDDQHIEDHHRPARAEAGAVLDLEADDVDAADAAAVPEEDQHPDTGEQVPRECRTAAGDR
jgi:hypothetical protein